MTLKDAFLWAVLIHMLLMMFLGTRPYEYIDLALFRKHKPFIELKTPARKPIAFRFMDVPESVPVNEPVNKDTEYFSDRASRVEGEGNPDKQSTTTESGKPFSKGTTEHAVMSSRPPLDTKPIVEEKKENPYDQKKNTMDNDLDGTMVVSRTSEPERTGEKEKPEVPLNLIDAAKNVGDFFDDSKYDNPNGDVGGLGLSFDVNFSEFGWYAKIIKRRIHRNWTITLRSVLLRETGITEVIFTIHRNGDITDLQLARSSGSTLLDAVAMNAIKASKPLPRLPDDFPRDIVNAKFSFEVYSR